MHPLDKRVAGITCREVLVLLGDVLDGELDAAQLAQVHGHLAGCDQCERFGGRIGTLVTSLRALRSATGPAPEAVSARLHASLGERLGPGRHPRGDHGA